MIKATSNQISGLGPKINLQAEDRRQAFFCCYLSYFTFLTDKTTVCIVFKKGITANKGLPRGKFQLLWEDLKPGHSGWNAACLNILRFPVRWLFMLPLLKWFPKMLPLDIARFHRLVGKDGLSHHLCVCNFGDHGAVQLDVVLIALYSGFKCIFCNLQGSLKKSTNNGIWLGHTCSVILADLLLEPFRKLGKVWSPSALLMAATFTVFTR